MFGGNSNWRGPVWFPLNYLVDRVARHWDDWFGADFTVEYPTGSGRHLRLGRRWPPTSPDGWSRSGCPTPTAGDPSTARSPKFQTDPEWRDLLLFHEYFHGDTGAGLGASHQTGWTGLVAHLLCRGGVLERLERGDSIDRPARPLKKG